MYRTAARHLRNRVAVPAGAVSDTVARLLADKLLASLARPAVVENRPGTSGRVGVDVLKRATPDGPTLLFVPTFREQGYPTVEASGWHAVHAPDGTPAALIDKLSTAIVAPLGAPEPRTRLAGIVSGLQASTPGKLVANMATDTAHWAPIIRAAAFGPGRGPADSRRT